MVKESLGEVTESLEQVQRLVERYWPTEVVAGFELLKGGYSATNYLITTATGQRAVLKLCRGYTVSDVQEQAKIAAHLAQQGFSLCCHPYPLAQGGGYVADLDGLPVILVNYLNGKGGDALIEAGVFSLPQAAARIGEALAAMHSVNPSPALRSFRTDGLCFLGRHLAGEFETLYTTHPEPFIREHSFVRGYLQRFPGLCEAVGRCSALRVAVLHGDAFIDNVLFSSLTGELVGFVDFEDACVGPAALDLAVCAVGNCFDPASNELDEIALGALISAYLSALRRRPLGPAAEADLEQELSLLPQLMQAAILLNASWRFSNFNITLPERRASHGDKYAELQARLAYLESPRGTAAMNALLAAQAPTV